MRGINIRNLEARFKVAQSAREKHVCIERREMDLIIRELKSRRREGKKLRLKRNKQRTQIVNLAARVNENTKESLTTN